MGDHVERRDVTASKMLRPTYCIYYAYLKKKIVIKHTEETNSFTKARKFCVVEQNVRHYGRQIRLLLEAANSYLHHFGGQRMGISLLFTLKKKSWILCLQYEKMAFSITR